MHKFMLGHLWFVENIPPFIREDGKRAITLTEYLEIWQFYCWDIGLYTMYTYKYKI